MTYEEMKKNLPKFNSLEEVRAYANKTLYTKEPKQQAPTVLKVVTPKQPTTPQIGAGDTTQLPKDYDMREHMGALSADKYVGELQLQYNDAMNTYYKSQSTADLEKAQGILKEIEEFQKKNPNDNTAGWLSQVAQHFPQFIEQQKAGIKGALVGAGTGFGIGAGIGTAVPGAGTLAGGVAGAGYGGKTGYVAGIAKWSYDQMRGSAYASLLELGARSGLTVEEQKYFNEVAREIASDTAFWQSVVESGEAVLDLATMGGFSKLFTTGAKTATQMTVKKMLAEALKAYGINILSEGAEEGVQERIAIEKEKEYLNKIGKEYTGTKEQESARVKEAVESGMIVSTVYGGANAGGSVVLNTINNQNATQSTVSQQPNLPKDWKPSKQVATQSTNTEMTKLNTQMTELKNTAENVQTSTDSKGRKLSKGQQEYFKDSKVRDERGRLLEVYHGTESDFNIYKSEFGEYFFTDNENASSDYGSITKKQYLNLKNPYIVDLKGGNDKAIFDAIDYAKANGYDGVIAKNTYDGANTHTQYVAFNSNQIKNIDNTNPTMSNDIRYEKMTKANKVDINAKSEYDISKSKKNRIYDKVTDKEKAQVASEVNSWRKNDKDGIGFIDLSKEGFYSYSYMKKGQEVTVLQKYIGDEEFINNVRRVVVDEGNRESQGYNNFIKNVRSRLKNNNRINGSGTRGQESRGSSNESNRIRGQQRKSDSTESIKNNGRSITKNSEKGSNFMPKNIQGLENHTEKEIKNIVSDYIKNLMPDITIKEIELNGSRMRGDAKSSSDLDVVVEYDGDISEDDLFNILNEDSLEIDGIKVDINPITASKSGTMSEYMKKSKEYDNSLNKQDERYDAILEKQTDVYYMEYPNGDKVEIIKNPTEKQMEEMRKEARTKYAPSYLEEVKDEPLLRRTYDSVGNVYYWQSIDAVHDTIENFLKSKYPNYKFSQNQKWVYNDERYDAMPMTAQEKLEKWADNRQQVYKDLAKEFGKGAMFWEANMDYYTQEQAINFVSREWNVVKKFAEQNNIEIEETYNFEKRIRESKEFQEYIKNIVAPLYAEKPKLTSEELTELAQDEFGTTNDFTFGAFMTPDGKMLDFEEDGYRNDHNGIRSINYNVNEFVSAGNIRIKPEGNGFELSVEPTSEQYETLAKYIDDYLQGQNIFVDITNEKGSPIAGRSYAENTPSSKIFNDIKEYFRTGKYPEKSELDDFRYDMMPTLKEGFYSQLESTIINKMQRQAKASDVMNLILKNGVKQDEIAWTGIDDFLAGKDTVTKDEVLEYIRANQIEIEEVIKADQSKTMYEKREAEIHERQNEIDNEITRIMEKYEVYDTYGDYIGRIRLLLATEGKYEVYNMVNLDLFDNRETDKYFYDADSNEYFTLDEMHDDMEFVLELFEEYEELEEELEEIPETAYGYADDFEDSTKFWKFATRFAYGDEQTNYREILFRLPNAKGAKPYYKREHWDDISNIFAHTRLQDYKDTTGNNVLFVEEIQSDMHQQGRKSGYISEKAIRKAEEEYNTAEQKKRIALENAEQTLEYKKIAELEDSLTNLVEEKWEIIRNFDKKYEAYGEKGLWDTMNDYMYRHPEITEEGLAKKIYYLFKSYEMVGITGKSKENFDIVAQKAVKEYISSKEKNKQINDKIKQLVAEKTKAEEDYEKTEEYKEYELAKKELERINYKQATLEEEGVDEIFPFKKNWHEFVIRKIINEAVQQGYDKVAWTTGKQQNDRYNLAKYIDFIHYEKTDDKYSIETFDKQGREYYWGAKNEQELEELLGKEIAQKIISGEYNTEKLLGDETISGVIKNADLEVGGEGMKGFYDKIIPEYLSKYLKKWNSKVEEVLIKDVDGETHVQQGFKITPEMIESIKATGQPLYDSEIDSMSRKNIINKITETFGVERFANSNKELNEIASNIKNRIKARTITVKEMRDIVRDLGERLQVTTDKYNGQYDALKDELRTTKIYVSDSVKNGFGDWNDFRKSNFGTLKLTNDSKAMNVGEMYTYLQDKYGEDMFPGNITNESDQLEKIADVASDIKKYNISIEEYSRNMYGAEGWAEIQQMLVDEIKAIRTEYDLENPMDRSKQARVADKKTKEILKSIGITEEEIYDPANAFVQNLLETIEKDKEYFSRTLHEIEEGNLIFGDKRTNNILNKRRYDVQNGIVKANPKYSEGASLSAMRKEIENYLGRKIGLGGFRQRAYGIYKPSLDTIRIKDISNMETAIHELGHRVDYKELKSSLKGRSAKELDKLAERAFATMYDKQEDRKLEEGWAEFTKRFVVDNQTTLKEYPELSAYMLEELEKNKNMKKVIENLVELAEQYVNAPTEKQIRKMQSIGENTDKRTERNLFDKFMYEVYDDLWDIKQMTREFAKGKNQTFWTINPEDNIYNLMRTLRANEDRVLNVMKYGLIDDAGFKRTRGMSEIVEKLGDNPEKIQKVRDLMVALRTLDYTAVKLDTGLSTEEALKLIANYSKEKDILDTANGIMQFQEEIMKYAVEKGLMKKDDYEEMKKWNKFYIPLKRVYDGKVNSSTGGKGASKLTKQRTGSMRDIIDPLESIIQNTSMILTKINQNEIMKTLARLQEQTGIADYFEIVPPPQKLKAEVDLNLFKTILEEQGVDTDELDLDVVQKIFNPVMNDDAKMIMGYMDNGVLKAMEFKDRNIYDVMSKTNNSADMGAFIEAVERFTGLLRMGATTGNIEFALPNVISDTMTAWLFSESNFIPAVDSIRGVLDYMIANYSWADKVVKSTEYKQKNKYIYDLYKQSGATMATRVASYRPEVQEYVLEVFGKHANDLLSDDKTKSKNAGKAILNALAKSPQKIQDFLSILPELSEQGTRFESFKKDYIHFREQGHNHKNALLKASANTRDITMDFNRMGHSMRYYNRIRAFSGARTQGIYRFVEGIQKMPKKVTTKLGIMVGISLAIVAMAKRSGNKKEEEITDQVRKDNFIIPLGKDGEVITIKKPQGAVRSVINFAEMMYNVASGVTKEEDYDKVWRNWVKDTVEENAPIELDLKEGNDFFSIISSAVLPTASEPIIENALNRDFYYGNPIIPYGKEDLKPEDQYDENTSQTAILLGKVLKQSPAKIENAITGWFAGVGQQALDLSDTVLGKVSDNIPEQPAKEKNSQMILRRFFANSYKNSNSVSEIYDSVEKLEQLKAYDDITPTEEEQLKKLNIAKKTMQLVNKDIKATRNSLKLNAEQKKNQINELQTLRTDTARYYLGKELINPSNAEKIELYEYWPASTTYKYKVNSMKTVEVEFTEADQKEYAQIARDEYNKLLSTEEKKRSYKEKNEKEKLETRESLLTKAKNTAKDTVAEKVYKRSR